LKPIFEDTAVSNDTVEICICGLFAVPIHGKGLGITVFLDFKPILSLFIFIVNKFPRYTLMIISKAGTPDSNQELIP
jgi:hypothetical protein